MTPAYTAYLGPKVRVTDVGAQKIDGSSLATYGMVITVFQIVNKLDCSRFFYETFLLADIIIKVILGILFLTLSNADVEFAKKELIWRNYTTKQAFPTTRQVKIINQKNLLRRH